ncbi:EamA domain-containing membrane protein RarD [Aliiruegeria haliotis]|uniref:EamA domain-containing membrane protein RarD n=1 Tax=Aliiruegeria haliotis TaxID=1280846 RepID=A0A2T0RSY2_9RHOB|nr:DMT family transporter [Aliiruegeria haliotis]PRY24294.1 EamA domain-containing membrane protein RarD [Aliiruegeria haliotis]
MTRMRATATGFIAVLLWALLALFTVGSAPVPPLQLTAMSFAIGGAIGLLWTLLGGGYNRLRRVGWKVYAFGTIGLFGYHFFYFSALRLAPPAQAGLIAYLWPLLIVLMSGLLPGERLRAGHLIGGALGFAGAALIILGDGAELGAGALPGFGLALVCAFFWSGYSVLSRRIGHAPTETVAIFCLATAVLSALAHVTLEQTAWPDSSIGWASVAALGIGPVGLAFYVWDIGVKQGDIQLLGVASYAAPLLSTLALILAGLAAPTPNLLVAAALITGGAALAAWASTRRSSDAPIQT